MMSTAVQSSGIMLSELCAGMIAIQEDLPIAGVALDSRKVCPGDLFLAMPGSASYNTQYISDAVTAGASAICVGTDVSTEISAPVPILPIPDLRAKAGIIVSRFFAEPSKYMQLIGVTGTNGKTSVTHFIHHAIKSLTGRCAQIGTLGLGCSAQDLQESELTTPDSVVIQQHLARWHQRGIGHVVMEVSSHALDQQRVSGLYFDMAIFTNLSHDHLDYHTDLTHYQQAKRRLFEFPSISYVIVNLDDPFGLALAEDLQQTKKVIGYSMQAPTNQFARQGLPVLYGTTVYDTHGLQLQIYSPWGEGQITTALRGRVHAYNLLASIASQCVMEHPLAEVLSVFANCPEVPGRMEYFGGSNNMPLVVVDYAHNPDGLSNSLSDLRRQCMGQLHCVFGCGGDRDSSKRAIMGTIADCYADRITLTDDNPRSEDPEAIIQDILSGIDNTEKVHVERDRALAIAEAITEAKATDMVLIAGRGHERYQLLAAGRREFCDRDFVQQLCGTVQ